MLLVHAVLLNDVILEPVFVSLVEVKVELLLLVVLLREMLLVIVALLSEEALDVLVVLPVELYVKLVLSVVLLNGVLLVAVVLCVGLGVAGVSRCKLHVSPLRH